LHCAYCGRATEYARSVIVHTFLLSLTKEAMLSGKH
jgi:hypothetical protein